MYLRRILVPTDFSGAAERALEQAMVLARRYEAEVHLLHRPVYGVPELPPPGIDGKQRGEALDRILSQYFEDPRRDAEKHLGRLVKQVRESGIAADSTLEGSREPYDAIAQLAEDWKPDLVCMGSHGREGIEKLLMGSVAEKVLRHLSRQVLILRDSTAIAGERGSMRILVPVDFSEHSQRALGVARELASDFGGTLHLLHVVELLHTPFAPGGLTSPLESEPELRGKLQDALRGMLGETPGEVTVADGNIAGQILHEREQRADEIVVMGSRGRSGLKHLMIGSVAERVARFCEAPVWVVK